jgi:hypothetical protein
MKTLLIILTCMLLIFQIRERLLIKKLKKDGMQSIESYHSQWLGLSVLWFLASSFFALAYHRSTLNAGGDTRQLHVSLFYLVIGLIYVLRAFNKDIVARDYLWTSKGKILWKDVRTYRFIEDDNPDFVYLEVESKGKTIVMKFLQRDQSQIESLIESVNKKFKF